MKDVKKGQKVRITFEIENASRDATGYPMPISVDLHYEVREGSFLPGGGRIEINPVTRGVALPPGRSEQYFEFFTSLFSLGRKDVGLVIYLTSDGRRLWRDQWDDVFRVVGEAEPVPTQPSYVVSSGLPLLDFP